MIIADFHLHSHFSRATSKTMDLMHLYQMGKIKGINVIGTGDFTHPKWFNELKDSLVPAEDGLFKLRDDLSEEADKLVLASCRSQVMRFILTSEISTIYRKNERVRKLHSVIVMPDLTSVAKLNAKLMTIGNLHSDGRPILGLDTKELLRLSLEANNQTLFIPAHIWTPWFSLFGSKSGFDSIEEAFEDLTPHILALETGLSSDPEMNWRLSQLDNFALVSNSDAHSPMNLGREANVFDCQLSYGEIYQALKTRDQRLVGTIEFFPEEGKYHYDGHRDCGVSFSPEETKKLRGICPKCGQNLVLGVDYRVNELADRPLGFKPKNAKRVEYIVPLTTLIKEIKGVSSPSSKAVGQVYQQVMTKLGNEFDVLRSTPIAEIESAAGQDLALAIKKMRAQDLVIKPGFDGVYGVVQVFKNGELVASRQQQSLF